MTMWSKSRTAARAVRLVAVFCLGEVLTMSGFALVPVLLPRFTAEWGLSATEGGWLGGVFFLGYVAAVPVLVAATDKRDARRVYLGATLVSGASLLLFALWARDFVLALLCWMGAGLGLAGTYMPGLRALTDRLDPAHQSRGTAFYTATFGVGAGLSYLLAEGAQRLFDWPWLFAIAGCAVLAAGALVAWGAGPRPQPQAGAPDKAVPGAAQDDGWRGVLRDRRILAYCGGYLGHNWELFGFRAWLVSYLGWLHAAEPSALTAMPGVAAAVATFCAVPASILGNEGAHRWGRQRWLARVMPLSALVALVVAGFGGAGLGVGSGAGMGGTLTVVVLVAYAATMSLDSAALTAGLITGTDPGRRGKALALYSCLGFLGAFIGPVAFGMALDAFGRDHPAGWAGGFVTLALAVLLGWAALVRRPLA